MSMRRILLVAVVLSLLGLVGAASASATSGALTQKAGIAGCVSETGSAGACVDGVALDGPKSIVISPNGANAYAASSVSGAVVVFDRDPGGGLTQKAGTPGCISESGTGGACATGIGVFGANSVTLSPDGANAYVSAPAGSDVTTFDRDPVTGALTQKAGTNGCVSEVGGLCADGTALDGAASTTVAPDGKNLYAVSQNSDAVSIFDRNPATGVITQKAGTLGCASETGTAGACTDGRALDGATALTFSPDGSTAYVAAVNSDAIAIFDRDPSTGALTQRAGTAGCISETGTAGSCVDGKALDGATSVAISADGASVYAATLTSSSVAIFDRNPGTGALTQKAGTAGCVSETGTAGACADGKALSSAGGVAIAPDGSSVYVASQASGAVATFDRNTATGALVQKPGLAACVSDTGTAGACVDGTALDGATSVTVSPGGEHVYAASTFSDAVSAFDRDLPPDTTIDSGPSGLIRDNTPSFAFSSNEGGSTFQCRIDADPFSFCSGPGTTHTPDGLADGAHTFEVRAVDPGITPDPSPASRSFTVDSTAPETTIASGPEGPTNDTTPSFGFSASGGAATFECRVDESPFGACSGPGAAHTPAALAEGRHTFEVRATDAVANVDPTPASREFSVDTTSPETELTRPPNAKLGTKGKSATVRVSFRSDDGASFECALDGAKPAPCFSPFSVKAKSKGGKGKRHTISVQATDAAGNVEAAAATTTFSVVRTR
jgi:6-phosphogluconolactonase (cycloisomerase 2 family)